MKENEIKFKLKNHDGKIVEILAEIKDNKLYRMGKPILCNCSGNTSEQMHRISEGLRRHSGYLHVHCCCSEYHSSTLQDYSYNHRMCRCTHCLQSSRRDGYTPYHQCSLQRFHASLHAIRPAHFAPYH